MPNMESYISTLELGIRNDSQCYYWKQNTVLFSVTGAICQMSCWEDFLNELALGMHLEKINEKHLAKVLQEVRSDYLKHKDKA